MAVTNDISAEVRTTQSKDLDSLTEDVGEKITVAAQKIDNSPHPARIYRVPEELRKLKESAYAPRLVSIGPLHSKDNNLKPHMQDVKMNYVNSLLDRKAGGSMEEKFLLLKKCLGEMSESIKEAKTYYAEQLDGELNEEMLVIDGCFILEVLYRYNDYLVKCSKKKSPAGSSESSNQKHENQTRTDPVFGSALTRVTVQQDLLLLENQLPFFVLEKLFDLTVNHPPSLSLSDYVRTYFREMMRSSEKDDSNICCLPSDSVLLSVCCNKTKFEVQDNPTPKENYHILHLLHNYYLSSPIDSPQKIGHIQVTPSASDLDYAGVKFVARNIGDDHLFDVNFNPRPFWSCRRARFEIPTLSINDSTEPFLRNLIAFEQCCPGVSRYITSYAFFMNALVDTGKDVEVLEKAKVIRNYLGANEDACDLFNKLCQEAVLGDFYFAEDCKQATKYSERCWPNAMAHLRRNYFASPWSFIAFCVASIAFGISVTNFVRSFLR